MSVCIQCQHFYTTKCNRDHFPGDPACGEFDKLPYPSRTEKVFSKLNSKLSGLSDAELIAETEVHCHLFMMNTPGGQYLSEFVRRMKRREKNK